MLEGIHSSKPTKSFVFPQAKVIFISWSNIFILRTDGNFTPYAKTFDETVNDITMQEKLQKR